ncbi:ModD protein [Campylobacter concisus]|jgi:modD protein|uniref:ModD protein n=1 Tax=Campylobacter concisus TaxID=199 RepID=UPI000CD9F325|nr:ModD protein [Campylobacter concisus]QPH88190.1 ModD protein [Campylobacter concisus]QPI03135.1 ModD protein [Campylobacter concisus]
MILSDAEILSYINEDIPYFDLTTSLQNIDKKASLEIYSRDEICVSCVDVAASVARLLGCESEIFVQNSQICKAGDVIIKICGSYENVHKTWKLAQVALEYASAIATYTNKMVNAAKCVNKKCEVLATRKSFPFAKKFCVKAVLEGGGGIHRLGLSDSILFFKNHMKAYGSFDKFLSHLPEFKAKMAERKVCIEAENLDEANKLLKVNCDVVQCDKFSPELIENVLSLRDEISPNSIILAAGGINLANVKEYANADTIVTSAMYSKGVADISTRLEIL